MELDTFAEHEAVRHPIRLELPGGRELRHECTGLRINADQLLVHRAKLDRVGRAEITPWRVPLGARRDDRDHETVDLRVRRRGWRRRCRLRSFGRLRGFG